MGIFQRWSDHSRAVGASEKEVLPVYPFHSLLLRDLHYAARSLHRNPVFVIAVTATLAIGIGTSAAVFSVVDHILFRRLPYQRPQELLSIGLTAPIAPQEFTTTPIYYEWRDANIPFQSIASWNSVRNCDLVQPTQMRLNCAAVSASFVPTLGLVLQLGRNFTVDEDIPNAPRVALISYRLWRRRFNLSNGIVGETVVLDGQRTRVIGVLPRDFEFPTQDSVDVIVPQRFDEAIESKGEGGQILQGTIGRLKPGLTIDQARARMEPSFQQALKHVPPVFRKEVHLRVRPLKDRVVHDAKLVSWVLFGAVLSLLLIVCGNVAGLLLARAAARTQEVAVRVALGATRWRIIRHMLAESFVLTIAGACAGGACAEILLRVFVSIAPEGVPYLETAHLNLHVLAFTTTVSLGCTILFGLVPAIASYRAALAKDSILKRTRTGVRQVLVATQIAVTIVLLASAGLMLRSLWKLESQTLGFGTRNIISMNVMLGASNYPTAAKRLEFAERLRTGLAELRGVDTVAVSDSLPPGGGERELILAGISVQGRPNLDQGTGGMTVWRWVTPDYFKVLDIPILMGAGFNTAEQGYNDHLIVLSRSLANRMFPREDPVGKYLRPGLDAPWYTVVGVAADVKNGGLVNEDRPEFYKLRRSNAEDWDSGDFTVVLQTHLRSDEISKLMHLEVKSLDSTVPVSITTMKERVEGMAEQPRFEAALISVFAAVAVLLAAVGLYGVIAFAVAQRTSDIGTRIALGASKSNVMWVVAQQELWHCLFGFLVGGAAAIGATRLFGSLLFQIAPDDPETFAAVLLFLGGVVFLATWIPARRATRINPVEALRYE